MKMKRLLCFAFVTFIFAGCAAQKEMISSTPISGSSWEGAVISKNFSVPRDQMVAEILSQAININDEPSKNRAIGYINDEIPLTRSTILYAEKSTCQSKVDFLTGEIRSVLEMLPEAVHYKLKNNTATGTKIAPTINHTVSFDKKGENSYLHQFVSDMVWAWEYQGTWSKESGSAKIYVLTSYRCDDAGNLIFKVSVPEYSVKDPTLWLGGQKLAELLVDWESAKNIFGAIKKEYVYADISHQYHSDVRRIAKDIDTMLSYQAKQDLAQKESAQTLKPIERIYKLAPNIMTSRIQRKLEAYKFSEDRTRFEFSDSDIIKNIGVDLITIIRLFPEEGGKTSVRFSLEYTPVYDHISQTYAYGEKEAKKYLDRQIDRFEKLITTR